jgi:hypothetical protein
MPPGILAYETVPPWNDFGEIVIRSTPPNTTELAFTRYVVFENYDVLVELHEPSSTKKYLRLLSPEISLYYGLTDEEISLLARNPFTNIDSVLHPVIIPLRAAYPDGIEQVPYTETTFTATWENKHFRGLMVRTSSDAVRYNITMDGMGNNRSFRYYGTWQRARESPLPDDFSLQEWRFALNSSGMEARSARTLGELRKKQELPKPSASPLRP